MATRADQLIPFTSETAREAGRRGGMARAEKARAKAAADAQDAETLANHLATFHERFKRDDIGTHTAAVAAMILAKLAAGQVPIRHAADAAELLKVLVDITRLEEGQATSHVMHGSVQIVERIEQMRAELTASRDSSTQPTRGAITSTDSDPSP